MITIGKNELKNQLSRYISCLKLPQLSLRLRPLPQFTEKSENVDCL
jgi:hypothetical protein